MAKDAIELLKEDHETVRTLLKQLTDTTERGEKKRKQLLEKIAREVKIHAKIEEEIFYPAFKDANGKDHDKMFYEAIEEHRAVEELVLPDLENTDPATPRFSGRAKVLKELIEHHADEEEDEMFPQARKAMSKEQLQELGDRMHRRKQELKQQEDEPAL